MKTPVASITASIQDQNLLQAWMMTSQSTSVITSEVMTFREARVIWGHLLTSLSTSLHKKKSKGSQYCELGGKISFDQWSFRLVFSQPWMILAVWVRDAFSLAAEVSHYAYIFCS